MPLVLHQPSDLHLLLPASGIPLIAFSRPPILISDGYARDTLASGTETVQETECREVCHQPGAAAAEAADDSRRVHHALGESAISFASFET